ncbi:hypothetical protein B0T17DRAFT_495739 [Bombardia bombarda]|uniref:Mannosyl phosphorylinositol ceramide synthase SUR1 n=1 Tax=Bombardia bombarda TaxID=252184 RepID=A0AA39WLU6_9PEZI|nr:hypothetical protein B0T17DRAFT_495739 [Bombardia bombarda]
MRLRTLTPLLLAVFGVALFTLITSRVLLFVHIFSNHSGTSLTQEEIEAAYNTSTGGGHGEDPRQQYIPRIIHQIFHNWKDPNNETMPSDWDAERQSCIINNPDFEYHLWSERKSREFIATNYDWFLPTYDGYSLPVQRIDSLRYFLLRHFGGIYIDLDNGCSRSLTPLLSLSAFLTDGGHGALSNNLIAARPNHPFWTLVTESLIPWGYKYPFPYFTISYSSGQWFVTALWERYHRQLERLAVTPEEDKIYRIMMDMRDGADRWVFFTQGRGGTWDNWDNHLFSYIGNVLVPRILENLLFIGMGLVAVVGLTWALRRWCRRGAGRGYRKLPPPPETDGAHEMV